jgi:succinoglycan biosynthesis transport protein ExoP
MSRTPTRQRKASLTAGQLWNMVKQRGEAVTISAVLLATVGVAVTSLLPNVYRATTTILVDPQKIPERYVSSTVTSDPNSRMNTLSQQVLSASRLQEVIDKNNFYPELRKSRSKEEVLDMMREKTKIELKQSPEPEQGLSSFTISYEDSDRALVALIANQLASSFIEWNLRIRQQQALGTTHFLSSELQHAKESLEVQEGEREAFKMKHAGATPEELNGNLMALSRLQSETQSNADAINRLDQERILLARARPIETQTLPATERDRLLLEKRRVENERWNLKRQFTNSYPDVVAADEQLAHLNARLAELPAPAVDSLESGDPDTQVRLALVGKEIARHKQRVLDLQQSMRTYQWKVDSVPVLETQMAELTRNYDSSKQNYQSLLEKTFSAGMAEELERTQQAERFTILDLAKTPEKPVRPKRVPILAGVLFAALLLPAGAAIGLFLLRGVVSSEAEMTDMLPIGTPILGTIPPIVSRSIAARRRWKKVQTVAVSLAACAALAVFLFKVRPTL